MGEESKSKAEAALDRAVQQGRMRDPRPFFRPALRYLRDRAPDDFAAAIRHFEDVLVPGVAAGDDPASGWVDYGRLLARGLGPGRMSRISPDGRATPADENGVPGDSLLLFVPDSADIPALLVHAPGTASAAQEATLELLIMGRTTASKYE